jgi:hypothetical protein
MLFIGHLTIFSITFFSIMIQTVKFLFHWKTYPSICGKNSSCGSLYFGSYTPWKIGFVTSPETSQKHGVSGKNVINYS